VRDMPFERAFAALVGGRFAAPQIWYDERYRPFFWGAAIDSRLIEVPADNPLRPIFFAIRGERTDGHRYVRDALEAGARIAVVDDLAAVSEGADMGRVCVVPDARHALGDLAKRVARARLVVAVTGSNGKTTAVRMIAAVLSRLRRADGSPAAVHKPEKSFNNDLGLPLTILNAPRESDVIICEAGINEVGEMERLAEICQPDAAVITSIGRAHLEGLGGLEGVAREKAKLLDGMKRAGEGRRRGLRLFFGATPFCIAR